MINIGLIGYGYWGPNVAKNMALNPEINLKYICDRKEDRLNMAKKIYLDRVNYTNDYKTIINDSDINAVAIATETSGHFNIAVEAINAGKNIFIEKPITDTIEKARDLKKLGRDKKVIIHIDHIMMYHPIIRKIKELIEYGEIGEILYFDISRMNLGKIKNDVSAMWDLAVHDIAIIDYLTGGKKPEIVNALGEKVYSSKETLTFLSMKYDNFIAHIKSSWISPVKERKILIAGTKKMVVFDDLENIGKLMIFDKGFDIVNKNIEYNDYALKVRTGDITVPFVKDEDALYNSIEHFIDCIINNKQSLSSPEQGIRILSILEKADKSLNR